MEVTTHRGYDFNLIYDSPYSFLYYNKSLEMALCIAKVNYIPIDNFKGVFLSISDLIEDYPIKHLLFDKRTLRTFHQPSMEWYFAIWKPEIKKKGLTNHYKILPPLEWFAQAVNAGKFEISTKYPKDILAGITINYVDSIENAIDHLLRI
jgi:hypothetical protein